ncbi:hypothetical protein GWK08_06085 [Leptobacterium flavescens]|uniref:Uncharacterized protein n=1 Tax=Leptobacterium flavescens TaxID=472055 RepID=A0A6P0UKQ7_9FLAO|nr:hypothetical protein [Leptobacterium flavescens]NER13000.1 hypothetical protein [Leptobacterium flavescens]
MRKPKKFKRLQLNKVNIAHFDKIKGGNLTIQTCFPACPTEETETCDCEAETQPVTMCNSIDVCNTTIQPASKNNTCDATCPGPGPI